MKFSRFLLLAAALTAFGQPALATDTVLRMPQGNVKAVDNGDGTVTPYSAPQAGVAVLGKVGIDQTTPGTTNGVQVNAALPAGAAVIGKVGVDQTTPGTTNAVVLTSQYPGTATPITAAATGTTGATTATLAGTSAKTTYLCGFSIRANATAAATGTATVTGIITGTLSFVQWTAPLASGIGAIEPNIGTPCIPASATNTGIAVVSAAPGSGGTVSVSAWGYQQ